MAAHSRKRRFSAEHWRALDIEFGAPPAMVVVQPLVSQRGGDNVTGRSGGLVSPEGWERIARIGLSANVIVASWDTPALLVLTPAKQRH